MNTRIIHVTVAVLCAFATTAAAQELDGLRAQAQFEKYCAPCHGSAGAGDGELGAVLRQKPKDFTDCADMALSSDDEVFDAIKNGGDGAGGASSDMPAMRKSLSDGEIRALVVRVRQFCMPQGTVSIARQRTSGMGR